MNPEDHVLEAITSLDELIRGLRTQLGAEPPKPTIGDYLKLLQLRLELGKTHGENDNRPLNVHWVDDETGDDPDPDPNVPWPAPSEPAPAESPSSEAREPGDESLT
jgi:hypothetical protein